MEGRRPITTWEMLSNGQIDRPFSDPIFIAPCALHSQVDWPIRDRNSIKPDNGSWGWKMKIKEMLHTEFSPKLGIILLDPQSQENWNFLVFLPNSLVFSWFCAILPKHNLRCLRHLLGTDYDSSDLELQRFLLFHEVNPGFLVISYTPSWPCHETAWDI